MVAKLDVKDRTGLATVKEAAEHLRLSSAKVYQLMSKGTLPAVKIGGSRRVRWSTLDAFIQQHEGQGRGE
jgi:excisionase family DNA binding protein